MFSFFFVVSLLYVCRVFLVIVCKWFVWNNCLYWGFFEKWIWFYLVLKEFIYICIVLKKYVVYVEFGWSLMKNWERFFEYKKRKVLLMLFFVELSEISLLVFWRLEYKYLLK